MIVRYPGGSYPVEIKSDLRGFGAALKEALTSSRAFVVTDDVVEGLYLKETLGELKGMSVGYAVIPHGEKSKNIDVYADLLKKFKEFSLKRGDCVVALGGGVVGDVAGFAAATYMRGVRLVYVPTTLLAMVDSSVGGKTAIDFLGVKNLVGAFHMPSLVYVPLCALDTLPERETASGLGEVAKCALLTGDKAFNGLIDGDLKKDDYRLFIEKCIGYKAEIVCSDPLDEGKRRLLNLGHTVGHAIEAESGFSLAHGECVAAGLFAAIDLSAKYYPLGEDAVAEMKKYLKLFEGARRLPTPDGLRKYLSLDKKSDGETIEVVLLSRPGKPDRVKFTVNELARLLNEGKDR